MAASTDSVVVDGMKPHRRYIGLMKQNRETDKGKYAAFYNIPYAKKPEGVKRYQAPESLDASETDPYDARVFEDKPCAQIIDNNQVLGSADCLYLNIFIPNNPDEIHDLLPVLVYIHGGGFERGSNDPEFLSPDLIIQEGLVFISINYRLGIHGFFNEHTDECPGNAGLKDQQKALQWIQENISAFKGNPKNVTISGHSAGATCVHLHLIAPTSQDLFHKAIMHSGGIFFPWGYIGHEQKQKDLFMKNARFKKLHDEYKGETKRLYLVMLKLLNRDRYDQNRMSYKPYFGPSVETIRDGAFIHEDIEEMMKNVNHVKPVMAGITKEEGIDLFKSLDLEKRAILNEWSKYFPKFLIDNLQLSEQSAKECADDIKKRYFPGCRFDSDEFLKEETRIPLFAKLLHDMMCHRFHDGFRFGKDEKIHRNLYVYQFEFFGALCLAKNDQRLKKYFNDATHGDDIRYLYCKNSLWPKLVKARLDQDWLVAKRMCKMWANFCRDGIPDNDWTPHTEENPCYFRIIGEDMVLERTALGTDRWDWLHDLVAKRRTVDSLSASPVGKPQ